MIKTLFCMVTCAVIVSAGPAATSTTTAPTETEKKLALESQKYCKSTIGTEATSAMVMEKVKEACAQIEKEGENALTKLQGDKSPFIFAGTYLQVNGFDGVMIMHPMSPSLNGKNLMDLKDKNGKLFFAEMINLCKDKGEGWIDYYWPKPGAEEPSPKVAYVHKAKCGDKDIVVGCGVYDVTLEEMQQSDSSSE